jgi:hypothetical protein
MGYEIKSGLLSHRAPAADHHAIGEIASSEADDQGGAEGFGLLP